jgi:hypothetical protein
MEACIIVSNAYIVLIIIYHRFIAHMRADESLRHAAVKKIDSSSPGLVYKDLLVYNVKFDLSCRQKSQNSRRRNPLARNGIGLILCL